MHDVHSTGNSSLEVLEGGGWEAHLELVAQNLSDENQRKQALREERRLTRYADPLIAANSMQSLWSCHEGCEFMTFVPFTLNETGSKRQRQ